MDDDFFRREFEQSHHRRDNLFAWTVFILLLTGFSLACWLGSYYVFGHPENPHSYRILKKLKKLEPPKRFELTAAPPGEFLAPQKLYEKYATMSAYDLQNENAELLRNYLRNYQDNNKLVPYLIGRFTILGSHELKGSDFFPAGVVALAQAADYPQMLLEHVYTSDPENVSQLKKMLMPGLDIKLEKTLDLSAIIHVERLDDGRLLFTAVPLLYGSYALKQGSGSFSLQPPADVHLEAGMPIIKAASLQEAGKTYAEYRKANPTPPPNPAASAEPSATPSNAELVRVMPPIALSTPTPSKSSQKPSVPPVAHATPVPSATPQPTPIARVTPAPAPLATATPPPALVENTPPTPTPLTHPLKPTPTPAEVAIATPTPGTVIPQPAAVDHPNVPLQPFIEAKATPALTNTTGSWKTFRPGQMPRGRLLSVSNAAELADRGTGGERLYLSGQFIVTASGENRAVLRAKGSLLKSLNPLEKSPGSSTRILVEFPAGFQPPSEGATFSRDEMRPFEIRDVQRARDGTINVFVREITTPQ